MPKFRVYQFRDAYKIYTTIIEADSAEHAQQLAKNDECEWKYSCVNQYDDREIPLDDIEELEPEEPDTDPPATVKGKIWLLHLSNDSTDEVVPFGSKDKARTAYWEALLRYVEPSNAELLARFSGNPEGLFEHLTNPYGELPNCDVCSLEEHEIEMEVANV